MDISASVRRLTLLFIGLFLVLSGWLVYWQVAVAQQVAANIHNSRHCLVDNAPIRGRIFDRNGVLLADTKPGGPCGYMRHYYDPSLAGLIGYYVGGPNYPPTGLEKTYDDYLSGRIGLTSLNNAYNQLLHRPPVGDDIYLTIDERIQRIVNQHFDDPPVYKPNTFPTNRGSVIVTDPHTGEILAMLSRPSFDPNRMVATLSKGDLSYYNQLLKDPDQPLLERPLQGKYAPGSIYKTVTLMAALDSGHTTLDQPFDMQHALGPIFYNGQKIGPSGNNIAGYTHNFPVTTEYGYTHSDNIIFAQIGVNTGLDTWLDYNKRFYIGQHIPVGQSSPPYDLDVAASSVLPFKQTTMENNQLAADAYGQGTDFITPMQMSLFTNAIANGGQLMLPMIVQKVVDPNQTIIKSTSSQPLGSQQISADTATKVRQGMYGVVRCGTGTGTFSGQLYDSPWGIIGKTGTAQLEQDNPHGRLITMAPADITDLTRLPVLTVVAMKENGGEGGAVDGPMIGGIYDDIFNNHLVNNVWRPSTPRARDYCFERGLLQQ
jgi:cell division protein FtsI/penicillin-binding protein 2